MESRCETATLEWLPESSEKAPACYAALGTAMSLMDRLVSCSWGCSGSDHAAERLAGRAYHAVRAGLLLWRRGSYDEALVMARSVGEVANLLLLFHFDAQAFASWKQLPDKERWKEFRPVKVRERLERLGGPLVFGEERYSSSSRLGVHPNPERTPGRFDPTGRPKGAGYFQAIGALTVLNEIALGVVWAGAAAAGIAEIPDDKKMAVSAACAAVDEKIGGFQAHRLKAAQDGLLQHLASQAPG